jgi:hypothetical protein
LFIKDSTLQLGVGEEPGDEAGREGPAGAAVDDRDELFGRGIAESSGMGCRFRDAPSGAEWPIRKAENARGY